MFDTVLVANRGEIARRVMATCRRLGVATVAVFSDADADEPHVAEADAAVRLGPAPAADSYLDVDAVVGAAERVGADAVHPGYGFLSENPALPEACARAGVVFVGPSAEVIRLMGDKAAAKQHLAAAGVPVVPGSRDPDLDDEGLAAAAGDVGYPVLLKPVAGGGGKGMRAVHDPDRLADAVASARREAAGAFGDDRLLVERLVADPRHVEVQVVGDTRGAVIHVLERECSVQRRHQKILEETPSPAVDGALRARMGEAAVDAAKAVGYTGAGTVEFVLAPDGDFHFLEMNTRLQVEHPVTELVTGLDLVELQLRVAAGEPLGVAQSDVAGTGHALEARVYAEDPAAGFLPQTGPVVDAVWPEADDVRVDAGVESGSRVSRFYDPMVAKLVVHAPDRRRSLERMRWVLARTAVLGVATNLELLAEVVDHPVFAAGRATTGFVDEHLADWRPAPTPPAVLAAAAVALADEHRRAAPAGDPADPWRRIGPWRTGRSGGWRLTLRDRDTTHDLVVRTGPAGTEIDLDGDTLHVAGRPGGLVVDGVRTPARTAVVDGAVWVHAAGLVRRLEVVPATRHVDPDVVAGAATFTSPMPGAVLAVDVADGDDVAEGATLMVVEAMKMEHPIVAPTAGTVSRVLVGEGDGVDADQPLLEFDPHGEV